MKKILTLICVLVASIVCKAEVNPNPDFNHVMITGQVALITDMSQAMEYVWTVGDIDAETLKKGCFVQITGDYYITDGNNGYFRKSKYNDSYGYSYDWKDFEDESNTKGSLAKYGPTYMNTYGLVESNAKLSYSYSGRVVYFKYDQSNKVLYECTLRDYIGHYDWHDFYLQGYARTLEGTDPFTGAYDEEKVMNDPLSRYVYNINNPSEYHDSIPLIFYENPYQVDGPCVLMYKGKPWPLKLTNVEVLDSIDAAEYQVDPGTPKYWFYETDPQGDTIKLQSGVYIFFLSYYNQKDNTPLTLQVMRVDFGRSDIIGNDTLTQAEAYTEVIEPEPETPTPSQINPGQGTTADVVLSSFYSYTTKEIKYKYKNYTTPYGTSRKKISYYEYHTHSSEIFLEYPVTGLAEELGYTGCVAIPYGAFNQNSTHTNTAKLIDGQNEYKVTAEKNMGVPVVIYNTSTHSINVTYITYEKYQAIKASVKPIIYAEPGQLYNLKGIKVDESDLQNGTIYIQDGKQFLYK